MGIGWGGRPPGPPPAFQVIAPTGDTTGTEDAAKLAGVMSSFPPPPVPIPAVISSQCLRGECGICDSHSPTGDPDTNPCEHNCHSVWSYHDAVAELGAMHDAYEALCRINPSSQLRALDWLKQRLAADQDDGSSEEPF